MEIADFIGVERDGKDEVDSDERQIFGNNQHWFAEDVPNMN